MGSKAFFAGKLVLPLICMLGFLALPASLRADEIVIDHAQGQTTLPAKPEKVLVYDLGVLDTLDALGVDVTGVPTAFVPDYLKHYREPSYLKIGSLFEPDFEAVNAAEPDLIVVASRSAPQYEALSKLAPTIDLTIGADEYLEGVERNAALLGRIFDKEEKAGELIDELERSVTDVRRKAAEAGNALVILANGGKLSAYGPGSRFGWLYRDLGFVPVVEDLDAATHGEAISFEFLLKTNPDWLFVIDRDSAIGQAGQSARKLMDNELVAAMSAAQNDRIVYADAVRWYLTNSGISAAQTIVENVGAALNAKQR
ncbi:siderophore ABC transporter substrate-binding protein [Notoacmeibacter ruber]|uniref:Siderophore ABC transporter substrate-binding protein n=1 Tax=Notoacmeibacter ruber TaxID=2670375 RepID=A0A3L7JED5_9HYPH|nr:siderophore ABC transporter substrate-binding protein [Notoacmeibacter ruber]RLQ86842.1 siderophore ABC transporter substrate-binding protein [Notoacmeibacter ruber]